MVKRLLVALLLIPLVDALFLVFVAGQLGWQVTVALVVLTALLGLLFVRAEGRRTLRKLEGSVQRGVVPSDPLLDGALLLVAGAFLLTPGLVTDSLGFLLVVPPTRYVIRAAIKRFVVTPYLDRKTGGFATGNVYTFGFPDPSETDAGGREVYDVDAEFTDVDLDEEDERS
jgi:UPF0716 protein FxsA